MEMFRQLQQYLPPFALDVFKLSFWLLLLMVVFVPLERLCGLHPQKVFRNSFVTDLGYYFINSLLPKFILILPLSIIAITLHKFVPGWFYVWVADTPLWQRFAAAMIVGEIGTYWGHRWSHESAVLWRFHAIHHSAEEMDWLVNTRAHPLDMVFARLCGLIPIYVLGLAQPTANTVDVMPLLYAVVGTVWSFFIHANVRWRFGWLEWLVSTPAFHHWHHTKDGPRYINKNYAAIFPWVDKIFGTFYLPRNQWPMRYGVEDSVGPRLVAQLLYPLVHRRKASSVPTNPALVDTTVAENEK